MKLVTDALEGVAYERDSAVVSLVATKRYTIYPDPPRTEIEIMEMLDGGKLF